LVYKSWVICRFLFDKHCPDYKYYEYQLAEEEKALAQSKEAEASKSGSWHNFFVVFYNLTSVQVLMLYALVNAANSGIASFKAPGGTHRSSFEQKSNYQTPASALYGAYEGSSSQGSSSSYGKICIHCFLVFFVCYLANPSIFFTCRIRSVLSQAFLTLTINFKKSM